MARTTAALSCVIAVAAGLGGPPAHAAPKVVEKVEYYAISGKTGPELLRDMARRGPRQGFLTKAIAQTRYETRADGRLRHAAGVCRFEGGTTLEVTYIYPKPSHALDRDLARRWRIFQADNERHEKVHGKIARELAVELDRRLRAFALPDGPSCWKATAALKRERKALFDLYEKKQVAFDVKEHREGGPVDRSIEVLLGTR
jgi:predicted secreted Zn-dependent protease